MLDNATARTGGEGSPSVDVSFNLARQFEDSQRLIEVNRALVGLFDFDAVTSVICGAVRRLLGADGATFVMREGGQVHYVAEDAIAPLWKGQRFPIQACVSGRAMLASEPQAIVDIYADPNVPHDAYRPTFVSSMALVPVGPGMPVASIGAYWAQRHEIGTYELDLMRSLASVADLALAGVRAYEEARRARADAEEANRLKDEFLATLSHELRNPLNIMGGYAELLRQDADAMRDPRRQRAIDGIYRNARAQAQLVSDLLDLSRLRTGKLAITRGPSDLGLLIEEAAAAVGEMARTKGVLVRVEASSRVVVHSDPVRVQQILSNLAHNAVKFTPAGGRVTLQSYRDGDQGVVKVTDTGQGIDPVFLPHVFDVFRLADASSTRRHGGLGIGLALVRQLAELHGGSVAAHSAGPGCGSTFVVRLPLLAAPEPPCTDSHTTGCQLVDARILVVDDIEDSAEMLAALLGTEGAIVSAATCAADALRLAQAATFDLIVSDLSMPDMDGFQLLGKLRRIDGFGDTPAIALSGLGRDGDVTHAREAGFIAHLTKPVQFATLIDVARKALDRRC